MVIVFSLLLITGILLGQVCPFPDWHDVLAFITSVCLAFIMIEVGLEFSVDQRRPGGYGWDTFVASTAAFLPVLLWCAYFIFFLKEPWRPAVLAGVSSAPTSAGILFAMMTAAGLQVTWVFRKARVLAVLDDLVTVILLVPLQIVLHGFDVKSLIVLLLILGFLFAAFRWQNTVSWPTTRGWLLFYALLLSALVLLLKQAAHIHIEVLIPAFMGGCLLRVSQGHQIDAHPGFIPLDVFIKGLFMLLVGVSFPKISITSIPWGVIVGHVVALTVLSNLGKMFCLLCYRKEASWRERLALSVAMFPRGEVGAAVLLIAAGYGFSGQANTLAMISLAFNLVLTGIFIAWVIRLLREPLKGTVKGR